LVFFRHSDSFFSFPPWAPPNIKSPAPFRLRFPAVAGPKARFSWALNVSLIRPGWSVIPGMIGSRPKDGSDESCGHQHLGFYEKKEKCQ
jgi:hypothetical protein